MKHSKIAILTTLFLAGLSGCTTTFENIEKDANAIKENTAVNMDLVDRMRQKDKRWKNITITNSIFAPPVESKEVKRPSWWYNKIVLNTGAVTFGSAVNAILNGTGVNVSFRNGIDTNKYFSFKGDTIGEAIESISGASGYSFSIPAKNKIVFSLYETRTFSIAALPGSESFAQGQNQKISSDSTVSSSDEYIKVEGEIDILEETYLELLSYSSFNDVESANSSATNDLLLPTSFPIANIEESSEKKTDGKDTSKAKKKKKELKVSEIPIFVSRATSTITVKDTPEVLNEMQRLVDIKNRKLLTQIELEIDLIELQLTEEGARNFDLAASLAGISNYGFKFGTNAAVNTANTMIGAVSTNIPTSVISASVTNGKFSGTQAVMEALRSVGSVSNRTMPKQIIRNNTIAKMRAFDNVGFIKERAISTTANVGTESSIEPGNLEIGFSMYAMPTVFENNVSMRLATNLSNLITLTKKGDTDTSTEAGETSTKSYIESPHTTHKDFMSSFAAYNGDTIILSGLSRDLKQIEEATGITSMSQSQSSSRTETLMLVTPRIIHPRI